MLTDVVIPSVGESITSVFIAAWLKQPGDSVAVGDPILEIDSDKASLEVPSPVAGVLRETLGEEGDEINIGAVVARIEEGAVASAPAAATPAPDASPAPAAPAEDGRASSGPAARQLAQQKGVDIAGVAGSGSRGRVLSQDVAAAAGSTAAASSAPAPAPVAAKPAPRAPAAPVGERVERVAMSPLRRTIARRLVESKQTTAMLTTFNEVDLSAVKALRKQYQEGFVARHGIKLGFMSFFIKAAVEALKEFPAVNAEIDGNHILYKKYYNIGVAVSTPKGLTVPVIRDADQLTFAGIEGTISELGGRARNNKLTLADFQDGTFTISNGGVFGSMMSTPILNPPQVGILGMHAIQDRPVGVNGQIVLRPMMYLALSYDHRIIDGKEAVSFLVRIKQLVEAPERLLLEV